MWLWCRKKLSDDHVTKKFEEVSDKLQKTNIQLEIEIKRTRKLVVGFDFGDHSQ